MGKTIENKIFAVSQRLLRTLEMEKEHKITVFAKRSVKTLHSMALELKQSSKRHIDLMSSILEPHRPGITVSPICITTLRHAEHAQNNRKSVYPFCFAFWHELHRLNTRCRYCIQSDQASKSDVNLQFVINYLHQHIFKHYRI